MIRPTIEAVLFDEATNEAIREPLPEAAVAFFEIITHLGDGAALIVFATLLYWFGAESRRRTRALVIAIGLGALAISAGMKGIFAQPRPELAFAAADYPGYSFPSAHALGAAAFYGALAVVSETGTRRQRYAVAGTVVALVALSRVVIGVHYLGDVLVGVAVGLLFVWAVLRYGEYDPGPIFALAGLIAAGAYVLGSTEFTTLTIGAALGATLSWTYIRDRSASPSGAAILLLGLLCLPPLLALRAIFGVGDGTWWGLEIVGYAAATAAILVVPNVAERLNDWSPTVWLQRRLPFSGRTIGPPRQ